MANRSKKKIPPRNIWMEWLSRIHNHVNSINQSKIFAGIVILVLNISSKFVTIKLGKTMESYLKYTFSRNVLIFAMAWMGTRDIYIALVITILFVVIVDYLCNDESGLCCLPTKFMKYHEGLSESQDPSKKQIADAITTLSKLNTQLYPETETPHQKPSSPSQPEMQYTPSYM